MDEKKILNASEMGKLGGPARARKLTAKRRKEIATNASKVAAEKRTRLAAERRAKEPNG
jgi:hypothetical protein